MDDKFIVKPATTEYTNTTIRLETELLEKLDQLSAKSKRSRNQLINMSVKYALDNLKLED